MDHEGVFQALPIATVALDRDGRVVDHNLAAAALLGGAPSRDAAASLARACKRAFAGEEVRGAEVRIAERLLLATATPYRDADGTVVGAVAVLYLVSADASAPVPRPRPRRPSAMLPPFYEDDGESERPSEPVTQRQPAALVVDDEPQVLRLVARALRAGGFTATAVDAGAEAVRVLRTTRFDVVISDVLMPGLDGLELLRAARAVDLDVPVILMTGAPDVDSAAQAVEHGAFRYLAKPFELTQLVGAAHEAARANALARIRRAALTASGSTAIAEIDHAGLEVRFESALERLWMAFQPIVDARTSAVFGLEALMRSGEPSLPGPESVLESARRLGRLNDLGRRIRRLIASADASAGQTLFVNLHPDDLFDPDIVETAAPLTEIAGRVVLEVTERTRIDASTELTQRLEQLRGLGFRIAVDDIGAGYSGLASFAQLMPEFVKIDMSLVRDVQHSPIKRRTIRSLCGLCHEGGVVVIGEGVETVEEQDCLRELGCDLLQGYLLGRPSAITDLRPEPRSP